MGSSSLCLEKEEEGEACAGVVLVEEEECAAVGLEEGEGSLVAGLEEVEEYVEVSLEGEEASFALVKERSALIPTLRLVGFVNGASRLLL